MQVMFNGATAFNQDINTKEVSVNSNTYTAWNTTNVTNMEGMFYTATAFNKDIESWDTSNVTTMEGNV